MRQSDPHEMQWRNQAWSVTWCHAGQVHGLTADQSHCLTEPGAVSNIVSRYVPPFLLMGVVSKMEMQWQNKALSVVKVLSVRRSQNTIN